MFVLPLLKEGLLLPRLRNAGVELGLLSAGAWGFQAWGLTLTSASHAAFLGALTVVIVPLFEGLTGTPIPRRTWAATACALAGVAALELGGGSGAGEVRARRLFAPRFSKILIFFQGGGTANSLLGDAAELVSAAFFAASLIRTEFHAGVLLPPDCSADASADACAVQPVDIERSIGRLVAVQLFTLFVFALAAAAPELATLELPTPSGAAKAVWHLPWVGWAFTGLLASGGSLFGELQAMRAVSPADAALAYAAEPVWGAAAAAVLLGERPGPATWVGAALIVAGSVYGQGVDGEEEDKEDGAQ